MEQAIFFKKEEHHLASQLYFDFCGFSKTLPFHSFGPAVRDEFILHIVIDGKGTYYVKDQQFQLKKGDLFLIRPGDTTFYRADSEEPWTYGWLSFGGQVAQEIIRHSLFKEEFYTMVSAEIETYLAVILECLNHGNDSFEAELLLNELTYRFLRILLQDGGKIDPGQKRHFSRLANQAIEYIQTHYAEDLTVQGIAEALSVNRSHLSREFSRHLNLSIKEYLQGTRINRAAFLLSKTDESVENIAYQSGFHSLVVFSRMFKKSTRETATEYRKRMKHDAFADLSLEKLAPLLEQQAIVSRAT